MSALPAEMVHGEDASSVHHHCRFVESFDEPAVDVTFQDHFLDLETILAEAFVPLWLALETLKLVYCRALSI